jgi:hypothetical protein
MGPGSVVTGRVVKVNSDAHDTNKKDKTTIWPIIFMLQINE